MEYNVGDRVRIKSPKSIKSLGDALGYNGYVSWNQKMDKYCNYEGKIIQKINIKDYLGEEFSIYRIEGMLRPTENLKSSENTYWNFTEDMFVMVKHGWMTPAIEKAKKEKLRNRFTFEEKFSEEIL